VVVITGLTKNVQKGHLEEIFAPYGRIVAVDLPTFEVCEWAQDAALRPMALTAAGLNKGKAAIQYEDAAEAEKAASHMDGGQLDNAFLKVVVRVVDPVRPC
jgi:RNA-binding protein with serine-rich domain 1